MSGLPSNQTLYWRVRYRDDGLVWSTWSDETVFTTGVAACNYGPNLLLNPGAESGVSNWIVVDPPLETLLANECNSETSPASGDYFFAIGGVCEQEGPYGEAFQAVDVSANAAAIDGDQAVVHFAGSLKDYSGQDCPEIWLVLLDELGQEIETSTKLESSAASWTTVEEIIDIPFGTRMIEFHMSGTLFGGIDNDSYLDDLVLQVGILRAAADFDADGDIDIDDFNVLAGCMSGPGNVRPAGCYTTDLDEDGDVDLADFAEFQAAFAGSGG